MSEFVVPIRPRYGEVDRMGVVYHAHYLVYFEIGRTEFMRAHGVPYASVEDGGHRLVVVDAGVQYRQPARYDEELTVATSVTDLGGASVTFSYELRNAGGSILATGHTRLGCLDEQQRPRRLPAGLRDPLLSGSPPGPDASQPA